MRISWNVVGYSNDENNFPHKLLLTNTQVPRLCWNFGNNSLVNIKLSKTQLRKIEQSGGLLGELLLRLLLKNGLHLIGNALISLAKSVLMALSLQQQHHPQMQLFIKTCL